MDDELPARADHVVLSEDAAHRILARAIELDHSASDGISAADLRDAAGDVGISAQAFNAALSESSAGTYRSGPTIIGTPPNAREAAYILHRVLVGGLATICVVFLFLTFGARDAPLMPPGGQTSLVGYVLAGCGISAIMLALLVVKRRIPARSLGQDDAAFWRAAYFYVIPLWAVFEGAGIIGAVGALLTRELAPAAVVAAALLALLNFRPRYFEGDGPRRTP